MTTPQEKAAAARKAAEEAARIAAEAAAAAEAAEQEAADQEAADQAAKSGAAETDPGSNGKAENAAASADQAGENEAAAREIAAGYAMEGLALELGTVIVGGAVHPDARVRIPMKTMNRHGLVAGATGTGKTKTVQGIAEQLSAAGVPVVLADIKGDLSGLAQRGQSNDKLLARAQETGDPDWKPQGFPCEFVSLGTGGIGVPIRATITSFGPILLSKALGLNETQESTLGLIFHWSDRNGLALLDLKDLRAVIQYLTSPEGKDDLKGIGGVSAQTAGVILRALVNLEADGGDTFFGEPELEPADLMRTAGG